VSDYERPIAIVTYASRSIDLTVARSKTDDRLRARRATTGPLRGGRCYCTADETSYSLGE
jgi:hypothetical protein